MEQKRDIWAIKNDIEDVVSDLRNTREFQARYSTMFDYTDKDDFTKVYDHDTAAIMERVLFDRLYDEVNALDRLCEELHKTLVREQTETETADKPRPYVTAADMVKGKTTT